MTKSEKRELKEKLKKQNDDRMRSLRVVKYLEYPYILPNSPVEIVEGYILSDRDDYTVFASYIFKNVSELSIRKLNIRLLCYLNQNIPYTTIDFTYSQDDLTFGIINVNGNDLKLKDANLIKYIEKSATFGSCVYIPLPESYFTKLELTLLSVEYAGGRTEIINTVVTGDAKKYQELDDISKLVYTRVNIYQAAEEKYPTKVIPQFGKNVWLCCCGNKNPDSSGVCENCGREKEWQKASVSEKILEETKAQIVNDPREVTLHDKSKFKQNKYLESDAETQQKIEQYEKAMKNIAIEEKSKHRRQMMLIPKIALAILIFYLLVFVLKIIIEFQIPEEATSTAIINAVRFVKL
ncbi:MAG: hypothetical protein J6Q89_08495 [Clostridia bacterium]|nr:hypothetical protein [Clostridia bacterium]